MAGLASANHRVGALVLAAGRGERARPLDKLLVCDPAGRPMIRRTVDTVIASRARPVLLILGNAPERIRRICPQISAAVALDHAEGLAASLRCGIALAAEQRWQAALVCLGDMPLVRPDTLDRLIDRWRNARVRPAAVVPVTAGRRGNPVLWDRCMFDVLRRLRGDRGGRQLLLDPALATVLLDTDDAGILEDFDTPERLARFSAGVA